MVVTPDLTANITVPTGRCPHIDQLAFRCRVPVETSITERARTGSLAKMLAIGRIARLLVVPDQPFLFLARLHPNEAGTYKVGRRAACRAAAVKTEPHKTTNNECRYETIQNKVSRPNEKPLSTIANAHLPFNIILKVGHFAPGPDTVQAKDVVTVWENAEALLTGWLLQDDFQTDATRFVA